MDYTKTVADFIKNAETTHDLIGAKEEFDAYCESLSPEEKKKFKAELMKQLSDDVVDEQYFLDMRRKLGIKA